MKATPPNRALQFLRWFCREDYIEEIEGDLMEVFKKESEASPRKAKWKFAWSVAKYFRPEFMKSLKNYQPNTLGMYKSYFKIGWRNVLRNRLYSALNIFGLSAGMTIALLAGLWVWDEITFNYVHKNHNQLAGVWLTTTHDGEMQTGPAISIPLADKLRSTHAQYFKNLALTSWNWNHLLSDSKDKLLLKEGMYVEAPFPQMFSLQAIEGDLSAALIEPYSIVLSESVALALFGNESAIGKTIRLDNTYEVKVTGVYRDFPTSSEFKRVKLLLPWSLHEKEDWVKNNQSNWKNHSWQLFAQIDDGHSMEGISKAISDVEKKYNDTGNPALLLHPMNRWHLYETFEAGISAGGSIQYVWLFSIIVVFVILLACINFMNLSTARAENRAREIGVRKVIGSRKGQLIAQFLSESVLITFLSLFFTVALILILLPSFNELTGKEIIFPTLSLQFWVVVTLFTIAVALLAGSYPAFYLSSLKALNVIKGLSRSGKGTIRLRQVLVIFQFTISTALIAGTLIVYNQLEFGRNRALGYSKDKLIYTGVIPEMKGKYELLRHELMQTGGISEMSESSGPTTDIWSNETGYMWEGKDANSEPMFGTLSCTHDFGKTINWKIKKGRDFSRDFPSDSSAVILNETAARLIGSADIIGKTLTNDGESFHVIGVVGDMVMESPYAAVRPVIFNLDYQWPRVTNIRLSGDMTVAESMTKVMEVFKKLGHGNVHEFRFADEEYNVKFESENRVSRIARLFTVLAILIACLGLFGLSTFMAEQRQKEIGIRKVLGASAMNLWRMLSKDFILLVILSCVIAVPIAYYFMNNWIQNFEYRAGLSIWAFVLACMGALSITIITVSFQAIKIALTNPVNSLKSE